MAFLRILKKCIFFFFLDPFLVEFGVFFPDFMFIYFPESSFFPAMLLKTMTMMMKPKKRRKESTRQKSIWRQILSISEEAIDPL